MVSLTAFIENRLHVKIYDAAEQVFQIQESVWPRPESDDGFDPADSALVFSHTDNPFSFAITRRDTNETLFDTSAASLVFESQYLRLRTSLPESPNLYGLGESTDDFHLNTTNYTRTVSCDCYLFRNECSRLILSSCGTVMLTVLRQELTCMELTPFTSTTAVRMALTVSSSPALRVWTSKSTTPMDNFSSTIPLEVSSTCTS